MGENGKQLAQRVAGDFQRFTLASLLGSGHLSIEFAELFGQGREARCDALFGGPARLLQTSAVAGIEPAALRRGDIGLGVSGSFRLLDAAATLLGFAIEVFFEEEFLWLGHDRVTSAQ